MGAVAEQATTVRRAQCIAMFELALESTRRPELCAVMPDVFRSAVGVPTDAHRGVDPSPLEQRMVAMFHNGAVSPARRAAATGRTRAGRHHPSHAALADDVRCARATHRAGDRGVASGP
jgi:hypothetical protein